MVRRVLSLIGRVCDTAGDVAPGGAGASRRGLTAIIASDTEDWTWVLARRCPDRGLDAGQVPVDELADRLRATAGSRRERLTAPDAARRPAPATWAPLEHGAHARDGRHGDPEAARARPGRRSGGSASTVASLARYVLHGLVHHEADVRVSGPSLSGPSLSGPGRPAEPR
jgi:hypothetical protein